LLSATCCITYSEDISPFGIRT